jgi:Domain of unknown function (DUF4349)
MPRAEPLDPEVVAALEAIDAALHDEPVDPELAELAELSLILRDERPEPGDAFLHRLDRQVQTRFVMPAQAKPKSSHRGLWGGASVLAGVVALLVVVLVAHPNLGGSSSNSSAGGVAVPLHGTATSAASSSGSSGGATGSSAGSAVSPGTATAGGTSTAPATPVLPAGPAPVPHVGAHRQVAQSAHLALTAAPGRIDVVAQQVFDVIASEHGFVASSHVDAERLGTSAARFSLRVPSGRLQQTLNRLSRLRHARVLARSDASADITGRVRTAAGRLAQDRALHRSLLAQLAAADTTEQADRLQAQLRRNDAAIVRDEDAIQGLDRKVTESTIGVSIQSPMATAHHHHRSAGGGFTLGRALHDAGRVLVVAAGVALIALAVLVPAGLLAALAAWLWALARHRRRESTLGP